jgi:hypothetical protein
MGVVTARGRTPRFNKELEAARSMVQSEIWRRFIKVMYPNNSISNRSIAKGIA